MMLNEHRTPRYFWADAISTTCYISNRIFPCSILHLPPLSFALVASLLSIISGLLVASALCLKHENLDKFKSHSFDGILLGYSPHGKSYCVFNLETNTVVESCDVTFDKIAPCPRDVFKCVDDKEMEESIFVHEGLQGVDGGEDDPLLPSTS
jgi:hypothetical protein